MATDDLRQLQKADVALSALTECAGSCRWSTDEDSCLCALAIPVIEQLRKLQRQEFAP